MDTGMRHEGLLKLEPGEVLRLRDAAGRHVGVVQGAVWITQHGDRRDAVLEGGASFRFDRDGLSLVQPLGGPAIVVLENGLATEGAAGSLERRAWQLARAGHFEHEARRLRTQAVAALIAGLASRLKAAWRRLGTMSRGLHRPARLSLSGGRTLSGLNDHLLRDVGLRRDRTGLSGLARDCVYC